MDIAIVGAGPTGLFSAIALARRGHRVTVVDRDPGPDGDAWPRKGVMQFHHPHGFRAQIVAALEAEIPELLVDLAAVGAVRQADGAGGPIGLRVRRATFERVLRAAAAREQGVELRQGHGQDVLHDGRRALGVRVDGHALPADLVIDASGRAGRLSNAYRAPRQESDCGLAYVSRQYQLRPGVEAGPMTMPIGAAAFYPGYQMIVFLHEAGTFSTLIARGATDHELEGLRATEAFTAAAAAIPLMAAWTDPARARPITPVLPGGRLYNTYRSQLDGEGRVALEGLVFAGDAVCTTNPTAGRGVTTSVLQARRLVALIDESPGDLTGCAYAFDEWCTGTIRPWFEDHVHVDDERTRRWGGGDVDLDRPLPSDVIMDAAQVDPSLMRVAGPVMGMLALPGTLAAIEPRAREIYAGGWRPPVPAGPTRDDLAALVASSAHA